MKKIIALVLLTALLAVGFAGCSSANTGKLDSIKESGKITMYTDPNFAPFEFLTNGTEVVGVDIEIAKAIAAELGVELEIKEAAFDSIILSLATGKGDMALSGFTITEKRKESVDFSTPYINSVQYLIIMKDAEELVLEDLAGKKVGVATGYTGQFLMEYEMEKDEEEDYTGVLFEKDTTLTEYKSAVDATLALTSGKIDAVVMDEYVAKNIAANNENVKVIPLKYSDGTLAEEEYGVAIAKGNEDLLEKINAVVERLISEGKIEEWVVKFSEAN